MSKQWTSEEIAKIAWGYRKAAALVAAAELDLFGALADGPKTAEQLAGTLDVDLRGVTILADALAGMELLDKTDGRYAPAGGIADVLTAAGPATQLALIQHHGNCMRGWARLAETVRSGRPAEKPPSVRGGGGDLESFIEAMDNVSRPVAAPLVAEIGPPPFTHLLDVGAGPGTWTIAFLQAAPDARATVYDRPDVLPIARRHVAAANLTDRVDFVAGDFYADAALPVGADLAWVSAIVHQNSRQQNRDLLAKVHAAMAAGGRILIRDVVMDADRVAPPDGAMFAINMLVNTAGGGTFTFAELAEDLQAVGFVEPKLIRKDPVWMHSVVQASKPAHD